MLRVDTPGGTACGAVVRSDAGTVVLATAQGEQTVALQTIQRMTPVTTC
jgi:hypothetical protein